MPAPRARGTRRPSTAADAIYVVGGSATVGRHDRDEHPVQVHRLDQHLDDARNLPLNVLDAAAVFAPDGKLEVHRRRLQRQDGRLGRDLRPDDQHLDHEQRPACARSARPRRSSTRSVGSRSSAGSTPRANRGVDGRGLAGRHAGHVEPGVHLDARHGLAHGGRTASTFTYAAAASGNPLPNYSLVSGPSGITIDPVSGALAWASPSSLVGSVPVTIKASNVLGSATQSFTLNVVDQRPRRPARGTRAHGRRRERPSHSPGRPRPITWAWRVTRSTGSTPSATAVAAAGTRPTPS